MAEPAQASDELFATWCERRECEGARVDLLDLYELVADARGVLPEELPIDERRVLTQRALKVIWPGFVQVAPVRASEAVTIVDYQVRWAQQFCTWRERLVESLGGVATRIDHIGSTSVAGLAAKPIVDIQMSVEDLSAPETFTPGCIAAGFELYSRDEAHYFFHLPPPSPRTVQLHVCKAGGSFEEEHLLFRDFLRSHPGQRDAYAELKRSAAQRWGDDRIGYTYAKNGFIMDLSERATEWAQATGWSVEASRER
jgi:GrpB-like predicted nucleotidyltransferase (UPF0157 family)